MCMRRIAEVLPSGSYLASVNEPETITAAQAFYGHYLVPARERVPSGGGTRLDFIGPIERS
jgi:hypothetical protein